MVWLQYQDNHGIIDGKHLPASTVLDASLCNTATVLTHDYTDMKLGAVYASRDSIGFVVHSIETSPVARSLKTPSWPGEAFVSFESGPV